MRTYITFLLCSLPLAAQEKPILPAWDYVAPMKKVAATFKGRPGVVLHVGDSITYSNAYGQYARGGEGHTAAEKAVLQWMHTGKDNDRDGWYLARYDHPDGGRSYTACSGLRCDELLAGGKQKMPALADLLKSYQPQVVVLMIGTNDASGSRRPKDFMADFTKALETITATGAIPLVSTIPPHVNNFITAQEYNEAIRALAKERGLLLLDYEQEILTRRPKDWNGTLMQRGDVHPSGGIDGTKPNSPATATNLKNSGYLLRGWLTVQMLAVVKSKILDEAYQPKPAPVPPGKPIKLPITRDTWLSNVGDEAHTSNGGATKLKLKSYQEMSLIDIDPTPLRGKVLHAATLHVRLAGPERLHRVTIGGIGAPWVEGKASGYGKEVGASTFQHQQHPDKPWTILGSDLCSVILGSGGTRWGFGDASEPDDGWQTIPVDLKVLQDRVAGLSEGFLLFDDTGSEWSRNGESFTWRHFPNRFIHSRESRGNAPYLTVYVGDAVTTPPAAVTNVRADTTDLPGGEVRVSWDVANPMHVNGFFVQVDGKDIPRYLIPLASAKPTLHLRDLNLDHGQLIEVAITPVAGHGTRGLTTTTRVRVAAHRTPTIPGKNPTYDLEAGKAPILGKTTVHIVDELDLVDPVNGQLTPTQAESYWVANHLWNAHANVLQLAGAKNEFIAFQVVLQGRIENVQAALSFAKQPTLKTSFGVYQTVSLKGKPQPDPIVPLTATTTLFNTAEQQFASLYGELFIPHELPAGVHEGTLTLTAGIQRLAIPVRMQVWDFTLPNHLSFLPDMNGYGLPGGERGYYRMAHRHRTVLNIVPYSQRGLVSDGYAPQWDGEQLNFNAWDQRFGPYLDGSAFADLPRKRVPLECFYLPLHENWPMLINDHYNGSYWADQAFTKEYRASFVNVAKQFAAHANAKGWNDTLFQGFLNNKVDYKRNGWSRGSSPWLLDEPQSFQDFWALRYFAKAFHEGIGQAPGKAKMVFRSDISRPMWQRDSLDGLNDYNVVNSDFRRYRRMVLDRKQANRELVIEYGSANAIGRSNLQAVAWSIDAWGLGADGVLPWLTVGTAKAWQDAEATSLFYPIRPGELEPIPSIRLKAYRRGQQDVEYLTLLALLLKEPRWAIGQQVRTALQLKGLKEGTGAAGEDAGVLSYDQLKPQALWQLRQRVGAYLASLAPPAQDRLVELFPARLSSPTSGRP